MIQNPVCNEVNTKGPIDKIAEAGLRRKLAEFESEFTPTPQPISLEPLEQLYKLYQAKKDDAYAEFKRLERETSVATAVWQEKRKFCDDLEKTIEEMKQ